MEATPFQNGAPGAIHEHPRSRGSAGGLYPWLDRASGLLLMAFIAAGPWLFGAAEQWSMNLLNAIALACGLLLLLKWILRWSSGAWAVQAVTGSRRNARAGEMLARGMAGLTLLALLYCLASALNARATFLPLEQRLEYHPHASWLPFTYDSRRTWLALWNYSALAAFFWSLRDWLLHPLKPRNPAAAAPWDLPPRFQTLLWVISINATLLAITGILQKLAGAEKMLGLRRPFMGDPEHMFASFAFHGNAAQYLNLAWPAMIGLWWVLRERARRNVWQGRPPGGGAHALLLPFAVITAAAPMAAISRGGTLVVFAALTFTLLTFLVSRRGNWKTRSAILFVTVSVLALGGALAWEDLGPRLREVFRTPYANPNEIYENALQMAEDYPLFGIGPGAFRSIYQLYRQNPEQPWQAFLHDDWLETRVTFGWIGAAILLGLLALALARWFLPGGVPAPWEFAAMLWVSLGGCLLHAKFSFPLQVYSILALFLTLCCVLSCVSRPEDA